LAKLLNIFDHCYVFCSKILPTELITRLAFSRPATRSAIFS